MADGKWSFDPMHDTKHLLILGAALLGLYGSCQVYSKWVERRTTPEERAARERLKWQQEEFSRKQEQRYLDHKRAVDTCVRIGNTREWCEDDAVLGKR